MESVECVVRAALSGWWVFFAVLGGLLIGLGTGLLISLWPDD